MVWRKEAGAGVRPWPEEGTTGSYAREMVPDAPVLLLGLLEPPASPRPSKRLESSPAADELV